MKKENSNLLCWWSQSEISQKERAERNVVEQKPHSLSQGSERMKQIQISELLLLYFWSIRRKGSDA